MKTPQQEIITGIDLGTTQVRVAIGKRSAAGIEIIGVGESPSRGMRKGIVFNPEYTADAIRKALNDAEHVAGCKGKNVVVGISGVSILSQTTSAEVRVNQDKVSEQDVRDVIWSARRSIQLPPDREILHIIPIEYIIDKLTRTSLPLGKTASTLEVKAHIITVTSASIRSIVKACDLAGLKELNIMLQSLATAETVLLQEEREKGVVHIDIGGGSGKIAVFLNNDLWFQNHISNYGGHLTMDIAVGLRISMEQAEQVKRLHGCCLENMVDSYFSLEVIPFKGNGTRLISRKLLAEIIVPRMEEMFTLIAKKLQQANLYGELVAGAVITGGNSLLMGMEELANKVLNMPVRIGTSVIFDGVMDSVCLPHHATSIGLVLLEARTDGVLQGIKAGGSNSFVVLATLAIKRMMREFTRYASAVLTRRCYEGEYPLFYATTCRFEAEARRLLAAGAEPNKRTSHGTTPLMQAVYGCSLEMIDDLLTAGADPLIQDNRGYTVLIHALQRRDSGTAEIFQRLSGLVADHPLDCNGYRLEDHVMMRVLRHKNAGCDVPFDVGHVALTEAAIEGNSQILAAFQLDEFPQRILTNAMVLAAERGHLMCVRALIVNNADVNGRSIYGCAPLEVAAADLYPEIVEYLIEAGAKVDSLNDAGETPLYAVCTDMALNHNGKRKLELRLAEQVETARILLDAGVDVNLCSDNGRTALSEVVFTAQNPALVRLLLDRGAVPPLLKDVSENKMTMLTTHWNQEIREMLENCKTCP